MRNQTEPVPTRYVAGNPAITFCAGLVMTKPGLPIRALGQLAEEALEHAKHFEDSVATPKSKNAVHCFGQTVGWNAFTELLQGRDELARLASTLKLSTGYLYGLLHLVDMAEKLRSGLKPQYDHQIKLPEKNQATPLDVLENAMWHSRFAYSTRRMLERQKDMDDADRRRWQQEVAAIIANNGIKKFAGAYRIALFAYLYQQRD
jgi:CRISPR-associated protein Csm1